MQVHRFFNSFQPKFTGVYQEKGHENTAKQITLPHDAQTYISVQPDQFQYLGTSRYVTGQERIHAEQLEQATDSAKTECDKANSYFAHKIRPLIEQVEQAQKKIDVANQDIQKKNQLYLKALASQYETFMNWFAMSDPTHPDHSRLKKS